MKILIADASAVYKRMFAKVLAESYREAEFVTDGEQALEQITSQKFDIIVIDAEIAGVGALELLKKIKTEMPGASVLITARPSPANKKLCAKALEEGGFACMDKPIYASYAENIEVVRKSMTKILDGKPASSPAKTSANSRKFKPEIVLIAASTGGPSALEKILSKLTADFPVPMLIVQHMTASFIETLVQNLSGKSDLKIKVAEEGECASAGTVYVAPGGTHMKLGADARIYFDGSPPINGVRPSADALFESVAESFPGRILAVVLTGMGRDGEKGLARLKEKQNCFCVAQSEQTCVVYGMPRAAVEAGLVDKILDLDKISGEIERFTREKS